MAGERMKGKWALIRLREEPKLRPGRKPRHNWLLIKEIDDLARRGKAGEALEKEVTSIKTGRTLDQIAETKTATFLERREMGIVNIGEAGSVTAAGQTWDMKNGDVLYLGMGSGAVTFSGKGRFYITSCPAHRELPCRLITVDEAKEMKTGAVETSNCPGAYSGWIWWTSRPCAPSARTRSRR